MIQTILKRDDERGVYRVWYLSGEHAHGEPSGIYVDIAYFAGGGYSELCSSFREAVHKLLREIGEWPEYADHI